MPRPIPAQPNLRQEENRAQDLRKAQADRIPDAVRRILESHPQFRQRTTADVLAGLFTLCDALMNAGITRTINGLL